MCAITWEMYLYQKDQLDRMK